MHNLYTQEPGERVISVYYDPARRKDAVRKRVAAYCRVSTDSDAQLGSLENQMAAFRHQVSLHEDWELVQIYAEMLTPSLIQMHPACTLPAPCSGKLKLDTEGCNLGQG